MNMNNNFIQQKGQRLGSELYNKQGCLMKIISYENARNIIVEFQDKYKCKIKCEYSQFKNRTLINPYYPSVFAHGMIGQKYSCKVNEKDCKEYTTWQAMLSRCYSTYCKQNRNTYENATCCSEWLFFENFYDWLHSQENYNNWEKLNRGALDKDILVKNNKIYSPETCCLVPNNVNVLFTKRNINRGNTPIGVTYHKRDNIFEAHCNNGNGIPQYLGRYFTVEKAFEAYKIYKEKLIKSIAEKEFNNGLITKKCYDAMMSYIVEITD